MTFGQSLQNRGISWAIQLPNPIRSPRIARSIMLSAAQFKHEGIYKVVWVAGVEHSEA